MTTSSTATALRGYAAKELLLFRQMIEQQFAVFAGRKHARDLFRVKSAHKNLTSASASPVYHVPSRADIDISDIILFLIERTAPPAGRR